MPGQMPAGEEMEIFMPDKIDKLKIRILMCFVKMTPENCTVTGLARTLAVEKICHQSGHVGAGKRGAAGPFGSAQTQTYGCWGKGGRNPLKWDSFLNPCG